MGFKGFNFKCFKCEIHNYACQNHHFNGFRCVWVFLDVHNFLKSMKIEDMKLNALMLIIYMRILKCSDHKLGAHKSAEN